MAQSQKPVVISLGGSMLFGEDGKIDRAYVKKFSILLSGLRRKGAKPVVIVGGGAVAKEYCEAVRALTGNEFFADRIGIGGTRLNALLLIICMGDDAYPKVVIDPDEAFHALQAGLIPVGAGMLEGMTTDADAVLIAQRLDASRLINVSKVSGVYSADPAKNPNAKKFSSMTHQQLTSLAAALDSRKARTNFVFDLVASKLAQRSGLELHFVDGRKTEEIEKAFNGARHSGTVVKG